MDQTQIDHLKGAIESLLFVSEKPITIDQFKDVCQGASNADIASTIAALQQDYTARNAGMVIVEIAGGFQMLSNSLHAGYIRNFYKTRHKEKLSRPALETLAIIAYKQPVGRAEVEVIRGVNSDGVVAHLLNKGIIKIVGRKEVPGRPFLYGTTNEFLDYFGLKSLADLPKLEQLQAFEADAAQVAAKEVALTQEEQAAVAQESSGQSRVYAQESNLSNVGAAPDLSAETANSEG